jgi:ribosomal-protein-alanine N-acetyltransferase
MTPYIFKTERLGLTTWHKSYLEPFAQMNGDAEVMRFFPQCLTTEETEHLIRRINQHFASHGFGLFAVEKLSTNEFIGFTGFMKPGFKSFFTPCIEIGWRIKKSEWNQGYATEAAKGCMAYGFDILQFEEVYSFTSVLNLTSERVMQKTGMKKVGSFNHPALPAHHPLSEHVLYKIERQDWQTNHGYICY